MPIKPLSFKGDAKKPKKRKHRSDDPDDSNVLTTTTANPTDNSSDPSASDADSWTTPDLASDVAGPTLIVLPTSPPTCLASDAHGNIFASPLENIVDDYLETAEPHDVRQVWVASTVAGTQTGQISLKASHGGYLSCDGIGVLGARREARGVEEGFVLEMVDEGNGTDGDTTKVRFRLRTAASSTAGKGSTADEKDGRRYLSATTVEAAGQTTGKKPARANDDSDAEDNSTTRKIPKKISVTIRGDAEAGTRGTELVIKMQARFKPRLQQNKETKAKEKISRQELEQAVGRRLTDDEVKRLKRARKHGSYYEEVLDVRVKGKHDKFAS